MAVTIVLEGQAMAYYQDVEKLYDTMRRGVTHRLMSRGGCTNGPPASAMQPDWRTVYL